MTLPQDRLDPPEHGSLGVQDRPAPPGPDAAAAPRAVYDPTRPVPERPLWLLVGTALVCLALAGVGFTWWQTAARQELLTSGQFNGVQALEMRDLGSQDVVVRGSDRSNVSVTKRLTWVGNPGDQPAPREQVVGSTLVIENACAGRSWCAVEYTVEVPRSLIATVTVRSGDVQARDLASLQVTATSGSVTATDVATLDVRTESGDIEVCRVGARGAVLLRAGSGDVSACAVSGSIDIGTTSGEVDLELAIGADSPTVRVTTTSGDARLRLPAGAAYDVRTDTRSGTRQVSVPENPGAAGRVAVSTTSGDITVR